MSFNRITEHIEKTRQAVRASAAAAYIIHKGNVVHEWYTGTHSHNQHSRRVDARSQFHAASVRKTYLGLAVSLAVSECKISSIDEPAARYLNAAEQADLDSRDVTIRHLLTHTHGLMDTGTCQFEPGTRWAYNNAGVDLLIRIIRNVYDKPLASLLKERVFDPCELHDTGWRSREDELLVWQGGPYCSEDGSEANLFVSARELAIWGQLHLAKGMVQGKQILPSAVIEQATTTITPDWLADSSPRNGFLWYYQDRPRELSEIGPSVPAGSYQALGMSGCTCLVIPECQLVCVRMLNQSGPNPPGYDYLRDIRDYGDLVYQCVSQSIM
ncbi:serine hydrolase domain-containing protein [Paenibacillus tarimensis]|uniref:serine hydrolase domain-containing protein n=1 Tax=Paenibacillus tarimensis TaxID=416012 RepID=UPI001F285CA2|nr:serine hydrolase domain-containing protein [Paenibacillus tarimensis]MCF2946071.1 beta-lactamase family protein [Paenibacillus tarimensis]